MKFPKILIGLFIIASAVSSQAMILIPMDETQTDHLKAYGVVYRALKAGVKSWWLLNYRGGSFAIDESEKVATDILEHGVSMETLSPAQYADVLSQMQGGNMEKVALEKAPKVAVYTPPENLPWDDAVTLAMTYAEIPFDKVYDKEVLEGDLKKYDWLHLHHEDFTGQYSKFYAAYAFAPWYVKQKADMEILAKSLGFTKVSELKKAVAVSIRSFVENGGFMFAMCSATNTIDIALASLGTDIVDAPFDGDGVDPDYARKLDFSQTFAFENFHIETNPMAGWFDDIDVNRVNSPNRIPAKDFELQQFSAKLDPTPVMLTQNHEQFIPGFCGLTTSFNKDVIKKSIVILGMVPGTKMVNYIHGVRGKGQFAFLGGHDPEDYSHLVGNPKTILEQHRNSPGYRLILNNVLFPAAEKKEHKT